MDEIERKHQVVSRPATREDLESFSNVVRWPTAKAWIGTIDGEVIALGGLALIKGRWVGFLDVTEAGREYLQKSLMVKAALIRVIVEGLREARVKGVRYIYTEADTQFTGARELLERMGFNLDPRSGCLYRWKNPEN